MLQYRFVSTEFQLFEIRSTPCLPATWFHCIRIEKAFMDYGRGGGVGRGDDGVGSGLR